MQGVFTAEELFSEASLSKRYEASRTPVREALARLEQEGLIERAVRGYRICSGTTADVLEIYEVRLALEQVAASAAARLRTDLQIAQLEELQKRSSAVSDPAQRRRLNTQWHQVVWAAAGNETLLQLLEQLTARLRIHDVPGNEFDDLEVTHAEHEATVQAIRGHDPELAAQTMGAHLQRTRQDRLSAYAARFAEDSAL